MAKTAERDERSQEGVREVLAELRALSPDAKLNREQILAYLDRMPPRSSDFTSADVIRELRGPLPDDDPQYQRKLRGRR
jgi:hypothetical protein